MSNEPLFQQGRQMNLARARYATLRHSRWAETEEPRSTVIVTYDNGETWHDICTCNHEYADDIADALNFVNGR